MVPGGGNNSVSNVVSRGLVVYAQNIFTVIVMPDKGTSSFTLGPFRERRALGLRPGSWNMTDLLPDKRLRC